MTLKNKLWHKRQPKLSMPLRSEQPIQQQELQLYRLLSKAKNTAFGKHYNFAEMVFAYSATEVFAKGLPVTDYDEFYKKWLVRSKNDEPDVIWPGIVPYYAMSSGTSGAPSKYVPITHDMLNSMSKSVMKSFFDLIHFNIPPGQLLRTILMVGSGTALQQVGQHYEGDLSGIMGLNRPIWLEPFYRPGRQITNLPQWDERIEAIVANAPRWDIGLIVGNPMWVQIILEQVIDRYGLAHIHELWPNFRFYAHSGVFFEPYRTSFERLLGQPVKDADTYLASEGYFGYQARPNMPLKLLTNNNIYYEFIPVTSDNFDDNGNLLPNPTVYNIGDVQVGVNYAVVISTNAGLWRYLIGDTIMFSDVQQGYFRITGRTKLFLSVCGEHVSMDNLNEAVRSADASLQAGVREFTVAGARSGTGWSHQWWVSLENASVTAEQFSRAVDEALKALNDDYATERIFALHQVQVTLLPTGVFYDWLAHQGKCNGQTKIPRVMKGNTLAHWEAFLETILVRA